MEGGLSPHIGRVGADQAVKGGIASTNGAGQSSEDITRVCYNQQDYPRAIQKLGKISAKSFSRFLQGGI